MKKKPITLLLSATCFIVCMLGFAACNNDDGDSAENNENMQTSCSQGLDYTLNEKGYTVTGFGSCQDSELVIPSVYENKPVIAIGAFAFQDCSSLTSVSIPDSVIEIDSGAFFHCTALTNITIPNSVTEMDYGVFNG